MQGDKTQKYHHSIAVTHTTLSLQSYAEILADKLCLPLINSPNTFEYQFLLVVTEHHLELRQLTKPAPGPIYVDFLKGAMGYRLKRSYTSNELLAKAVGIKGSYKPSIIDATAGLGRDACVLARLGCKVTMIERSSIVAALLQDGLSRATINSQLVNPFEFHLINQDALTYLQKLSIQEYPDVIYLDPMYPLRTKSALVKKEMQLLRMLVGDDTDAGLLLEVTLKCARHRVVVKRPRLAQNLGNLEPSFTTGSKHHRFDIYQTALNKT